MSEEQTNQTENIVETETIDKSPIPVFIASADRNMYKIIEEKIQESFPETYKVLVINDDIAADLVRNYQFSLMKQEERQRLAEALKNQANIDEAKKFVKTLLQRVNEYYCDVDINRLNPDDYTYEDDVEEIKERDYLHLTSQWIPVSDIKAAFKFHNIKVSNTILHAQLGWLQTMDFATPDELQYKFYKSMWKFAISKEDKIDILEERREQLQSQRNMIGYQIETVDKAIDEVNKD